MGGGRCLRCGLRRSGAEDRCVGCGATFGPGALVRRRATAGPPRIHLGVGALLVVREPIAPPGRLYNIARLFLGVPSACVIILWGHAVCFFIITPFVITGLKLAAYALPFVIYLALSFYCCVRPLPARKLAALGITAHLALFPYALVAHRVLDEPVVAVGLAFAFGWVVMLSFAAAWAALYAGRLTDEGKLRLDTATQTALGVALISLTLAALGLARATDMYARDRRLEQSQQQRSNRP